MKKACLSFITTGLFFLLFSSSVFAQYASPPPGACGSWERCDFHGCPGGGTTEYECCPSCSNAVVCRDIGSGCGPAKSCTYVSDCQDNPYCPPPSCAQIACINGQCVSDCKSDCSGGPGPSPIPGDVGYIIGRVWFDRNGNGSGDEITNSSSDPDMVQNPSGRCGAYTNVAANVYFSRLNGGSSGWAMPQYCNPGPYYVTAAIPTGDYLVSVVPPSGWTATTPTSQVTVTKNAYTGLWLGINGPISCSITGSATGQVGQPYSFSTTAIAGGGGNADAEIDLNTSLSITGLTRLNYSNCGNSNSSCTTTTSWTPSATGTYYIFCRGYNASIPRECRPFGYSTFPQDVDCNDGLTSTCAGSGTDCIPFIVTTPRGWLQTAGGDVHGNNEVSTLLP